jgi:hypothetical protein
LAHQKDNGHQPRRVEKGEANRAGREHGQIQDLTLKD